MNKRITLFLLAMASTLITQAQCEDFVYIPDANFKAALVENIEINTDGDDEISCEEANDYNGAINVVSRNIEDLTGIEYFENITELSCARNNLTSLNVSNNTALSYIWCASNQLTSLDISDNTNLTSISCSDNFLTSLNVSNNTNLTNINCSGNQLKSLDVSNNFNLGGLICSNNQLTNLDVSNNFNLGVLHCEYNNLISLNIANGNNINLTEAAGALGNFDLDCIQVDDAEYSNSNSNWNANKENGTIFSENCDGETLSLATNEFSQSVSVYPNPVLDNLFIRLETGQKINEVKIYSLQGKEVLTSTETKINMQSLTTGMYIVKIFDANGKVGVKSILKK